MGFENAALDFFDEFRIVYETAVSSHGDHGLARLLFCSVPVAFREPMIEVRAQHVLVSRRLILRYSAATFAVSWSK